MIALVMIAPVMIEAAIDARPPTPRLPLNPHARRG